MKQKMIASALLIMLLTVGVVGQASARPWGRGGWGGPRFGVRVEVPAPAVVGGCYGGGYAYGAPRYYGHRDYVNYGYGRDRDYRGGDHRWHR